MYKMFRVWNDTTAYLNPLLFKDVPTPTIDTSFEALLVMLLILLIFFRGFRNLPRFKANPR